MSWVRRVHRAQWLSPALADGRCWWKNKTTGYILNDTSSGHTPGLQKWWLSQADMSTWLPLLGSPWIIPVPDPVRSFLTTLSPSFFLYPLEEGWTPESELGEPQGGCVPQRWAQQLVRRFTVVQHWASCMSEAHRHHHSTDLSAGSVFYQCKWHQPLLFFSWCFPLMTWLWERIWDDFIQSQIGFAYFIKAKGKRKSVSFWIKASEDLIVNYHAPSKDLSIPQSVAPILKCRQGVERESVSFI